MSLNGFARRFYGLRWKNGDNAHLMNTIVLLALAEQDEITVVRVKHYRTHGGFIIAASRGDARPHTFIEVHRFLRARACVRKASLALMRQLPFSLANRHGSRIMKPTRRRAVNGDYADGAKNAFPPTLLLFTQSRLLVKRKREPRDVKR